VRVNVASEGDIPKIIEITKMYPDLLLQYLAKPAVIKSFLNRIIVYEDGGYVHVGIGKRKVPHICQIAVRNKRNGVGTKLVRLLQALWDSVTVDCSVRNTGAMTFYEKMGFKEIKRRTFFNKAVNRKSTFIKYEWRKSNE